MTGIDTHAHVFARGLTLAEGRRYAPDYDAPVEDYLRRLDENGLSHGVLVQPSFLGTDSGRIRTPRPAHARMRDRNARVRSCCGSPSTCSGRPRSWMRPSCRKQT